MNPRTAALMLVLAGCPHSSPEGEPTSDIWQIDGREVGQREFERAVQALPGEVQNWSCGETTTGGIVSWQQTDQYGQVWYITEESRSDGPSVSEMHRVPE